jgi:hypothetical protein
MGFMQPPSYSFQHHAQSIRVTGTKFQPKCSCGWQGEVCFSNEGAERAAKEHAEGLSKQADSNKRWSGWLAEHSNMLTEADAAETQAIGRWISRRTSGELHYGPEDLV